MKEHRAINKLNAYLKNVISDVLATAIFTNYMMWYLFCFQKYAVFEVPHRSIQNHNNNART